MRTAAVCLVVFVAACSDDSPSSPVAPTNPMAPTTSGFTLSGTVRDSRPNGPALAGATVRLDTGQSTAAGSDGRYRLCGVLDLSTGWLWYASAGHPGPVHVPLGDAPGRPGGRAAAHRLVRRRGVRRVLGARAARGPPLPPTRTG